MSTDSAGLAGLGISLHRRGSADQLADEILERIVSGQIRPGTSLREAALADAGGVSRNTARETLRILVALRPQSSTTHSVARSSASALPTTSATSTGCG